MQNLYDDLKNLLEQDPNLVSDEGLLKNKIVEISMKMDAELIKLLLSHNDIRRHFFADIDGVLIFDKIKFQRFVMNKRFLPDSYTAYKNKIGLTSDDKYLTGGKEVVLAWPYKDCILEGGQTKEDAKHDEVFWNETLAPDQINQLFAPKVLTNFKKYDESNKHKATNISPNDNLIIKGNNLLALYTLKKRFAGKIKLIYIDPPYNTGNDGFNYNDNFTHSAWLTFMKNRLTVARGLLRSDGVIFVQCDDNEQAYLKVLMDEIFGRENFVGTLIHQRAKGGGIAKYIVKGHDYICIYSKNLTTEQKFIREKVIQQKVIERDGKSYIRDDDIVRKVFGKLDRSISDNRRCFYEELHIYKNEKQIIKIQEKIDKGEYVLEKIEENKTLIVEYKLLEDSYSKLYSIVNAQSEKGTNHLNELEINFKNPKPEEILKFIIHSVTDKGDIVLDYHLGSGTTAAVAHKMERQYIGVEQMDYIETVTVERLKKVIAGEQGGISKTENWQGGGSFVYCELSKANQTFVDTLKSANTNEELESLWNDMQERAFLSYKISPKEINPASEDFQGLSLEEQKRFLIETLDNNMLYVPYAEINDKTYDIADKDKNLNRQFHENTGE